MTSINSVGKARLIVKEISKAIVGKDDVLIKVLLAVIAGGHILMEDIPGVGKTTMAVSLSKALGLDYNRVQFTPDVLPSDITGFSIYDKNTGEMRYQKGAVLCNLFLADELNRATSRTQSALLQAMEEGEVTVDNNTYPVPQPFVVIATQNPTGAKGTQMLPDSQMDRFMLRLSIGYPDHADAIEMVRRKQTGMSTDEVNQVVSRAEMMQIRKEAEAVFIKDSIIEYIVTLCERTRKDERILQGASPRATLALTALSKATAWIQGRDYVLPRDVRFIFSECIEHRLIWAPELARSEERFKVLDEIFESVPAPAIR
ncbi:MAG: MoxR family ATPase [Oscillospiraceae bacterium]|nr:MoxR family ATPase [Oscillospiraceae bacterium]